MARGLFLLLVLLLASGCADAAPRPAATSSAVPPAPDAGALRVVVTTSELVPVPGAVVELPDAELRGTTDEGGQYLFQDLEPRSYTVIAAKPGFRPLHPQGRVQQVLPGETHELKLVLEPVGVVAAEDAYHKSLIFRGFISCSAEWVRVSTLFNRTQCGNGVEAAGNRVGRDPNDNFSHPWTVDGPHIESIVLESQWAPSFSTLGDQLFMAAQDAFTCAANSCNYGNVIDGIGGRSPLRLAIHESPDKRITTALERAGKEYPQPIWTVMRTHCGSGCTVAVTLQQSYEVVTTAFYGIPAPADWSARGSG